jgi:glycosyltransferase involved in cell wall biosynthesis
MNGASRLSIGLPVYNGEKYLAESVDSLLGQTFEDFELIISDNASTDSTAGICRRYAKQDSRIRYIRQPRNIGLAANHNFVIGQARGICSNGPPTTICVHATWCAAASRHSMSIRRPC